jgi:hypothetical protein
MPEVREHLLAHGTIWLDQHFDGVGKVCNGELALHEFRADLLARDDIDHADMGNMDKGADQEIRDGICPVAHRHGASEQGGFECGCPRADHGGIGLGNECRGCGR